MTCRTVGKSFILVLPNEECLKPQNKIEFIKGIVIKQISCGSHAYPLY